MPCSGTCASCSFTDFTARPAAAPPASASRTSTPGADNRTGNMLVNQPTVRERSAPGSTVSSRPWPSRCTRVEDSVTPRSARRDGEGEGGEETVVDAAVERARHVGQQTVGDVGRDLQADPAGGRDRVAAVEGARTDQRVRT